MFFPTCRRRPTPWPPSFFCPAGVGGVTFLGEQRNLHDSAPYNAFVRRVSCCNRAATGAGHARTEQEINGARNAKNCLHKPNFRQGSTYPESIDLTYKEEAAGSIGHRPFEESGVLQKNIGYKKRLQDIPEPLCSNCAATRVLGESHVHSPHGRVYHARQEVRVGVESHGYGCVSQKLLNELRVSAL